jgi:hypothetical protein
LTTIKLERASGPAAPVAQFDLGQSSHAHSWQDQVFTLAEAPDDPFAILGLGTAGGCRLRRLRSLSEQPLAKRR